MPLGGGRQAGREPEKAWSLRSAYRLPADRAPAHRFAPDGARRAGADDQASDGAAGDALERGDYVERILDPIDRRAKHIRLTSRSWDVHERGSALVAELQAAWAASLGPGKVEQLLALFDELRAHLASRTTT